MKRLTIATVGITAAAVLMPGVVLASAGFASAAPTGVVADQVITFTTSTARYSYGSKFVSLGAVGGASGNPVTATSDSPEICVGHDGTQLFDLIGTGTCWLTFRQGGGSGFAAAAPARIGVVVLPAQASVDVGPARRDADARQQPDFTTSITGLRGGDSAEVVQGLVVEAPPLGADPGRYPLHGSGATAANYSFRYGDGMLIVDPVIKVAGLPDELRSSWKLNGSTVTGNRLVVPYDSPASYSFAPFLRASATSPMYITTASDFSGNVVANQTAHYTTMRQLLQEAITDDILVYQLASTWQAIEQDPRPRNAYTESSLHSFAETLRVEVRSGNLSGASSWNIEQHVQAVYQAFGFIGWV